MTTVSDPKNELRWGKLQYFEKIPDDTPAQTKAAALLRLYNRERRELYVGGVWGRPDVRAGCSVYLSQELSGEEDTALCLVLRARHRWQHGGYFMDLDVCLEIEE